MKKSPRPFRPPNPENLANAALQYLGRFAASEKSLRRVLQNRLRRAAMRDSNFAEDQDRQAELRGVIESIIAKHKRTGAVNDQLFAETKINSLRRSGRSARAIQQKLQQSGVAQTIVAHVLENPESGLTADEAELEAAREFARRRRFGPFRAMPYDRERQQKDLAVMARAGFRLSLAREVLKDQRLIVEKSSGDAEGIWS